MLYVCVFGVCMSLCALHACMQCACAVCVCLHEHTWVCVLSVVPVSLSVYMC